MTSLAAPRSPPGPGLREQLEAEDVDQIGPRPVCGELLILVKSVIRHTQALEVLAAWRSSIGQMLNG